MASVTIYEGVEQGSQEFRSSVAELADNLRGKGYYTTTESRWPPFRVPRKKQETPHPVITDAAGEYAGYPIEEIVLFVSSGAASTIISAAANDIYKTARDWANKRYKKKNDSSSMIRFEIRDQDSHMLITFEVDSDGERRLDHND